jgi:adenosylcobinamide-phosphate synthase
MPPQTYLPDHLFIVIAALLVNAIFGGPRRLYQPLKMYHPARQLANMIRFVEKRLNRDRRPPEERRTRGLVMVVFVLMSVLLLGMVLSGVLRSLRYGVIAEVICVAMLFSLRSSCDRATELSQAVQEENLDRAREALEGTVWRNSALLDSHGLARASIEMLAMHFAQKVIAPAVWYVALGLPGIFASRAITLLSEVLAQSNAQQSTFGWASHGVYRWCMAVPNMLAALMLVLASLVSPTARPRQALRAIALQFNEPTLEAAVLSPIPVMASATDVALGGPASVYIGGDWVGRGTLRPYHADIRKAIFIYVLACILLLLMLAILA